MKYDRYDKGENPSAPIILTALFFTSLHIHILQLIRTRDYSLQAYIVKFFSSRFIPEINKSYIQKIILSTIYQPVNNERINKRTCLLISTSL